MTNPRVNLKHLYRKPARYQAVRDIPVNEPGNWSERTVKAGEIFYRFTGYKYGANAPETSLFLSSNGPTKYPFFEMPANAFTPLV